MSFSAAEENFHSGARDGIDAQVYWPGIGTVPAAELVVATTAAARRTTGWTSGVSTRPSAIGCSASSSSVVSPAATARRGRRETFHQLFDAGAMDRFDALREVVRRYSEHMHQNLPVHEWPVD